MNHKIDMPPWVRRYGQSMMVIGISVIFGLVGLVAMMQMTMLEEAHSSNNSSYHLSHEIAELRTQWSQAQVGDVQKQVEKAEELLLRDFDDLTQWLQQVESRASGMGLRSTYRVLPNRKQMNELKDVEVVSVDFEILPAQPEMLSKVYEQYLQFLRSLSEEPVRVDLQQVQVQGGTGAAHMSVLIQVWVRATV